ncbi:hypothetical protein MASR1M32_06510 [Rhodobacter sp.]
MLKRLGTALVLVVMATGAASACQRPAGAKTIEAEVANWINAERAKKGLSKLGISSQLTAMAEAHACDMAKRGFFDHQGPGGPSFQRRLNRSGYDYSAAVENIAFSNAGGSAPAMRSWKKSAQHWKNLMDRRLDDMGVAVAISGDTIYYVYVGAAN